MEVLAHQVSVNVMELHTGSSLMTLLDWQAWSMNTGSAESLSLFSLYWIFLLVEYMTAVSKNGVKCWLKFEINYLFISQPACSVLLAWHCLDRLQGNASFARCFASADGVYCEKTMTDFSSGKVLLLIKLPPRHQLYLKVSSNTRNSLKIAFYDDASQDMTIVSKFMETDAMIDKTTDDKLCADQQSWS